MYWAPGIIDHLAAFDCSRVTVHATPMENSSVIWGLRPTQM